MTRIIFKNAITNNKLMDIVFVNNNDLWLTTWAKEYWSDKPLIMNMPVKFPKHALHIFIKREMEKIVESNIELEIEFTYERIGYSSKLLSTNIDKVDSSDKQSLLNCLWSNFFDMFLDLSILVECEKYN